MATKATTYCLANNAAGYAVFGKVTSGMEVVDKIAEVTTVVKDGMRDVPEKVVKIESVRVKEAAKSAKTEETKKDAKPKG